MIGNPLGNPLGLPRGSVNSGIVISERKPSGGEWIKLDGSYWGDEIPQEILRPSMVNGSDLTWAGTPPNTGDAFQSSSVSISKNKHIAVGFYNVGATKTYIYKYNGNGNIAYLTSLNTISATGRVYVAYGGDYLLTVGPDGTGNVRIFSVVEDAYALVGTLTSFTGAPIKAEASRDGNYFAAVTTTVRLWERTAPTTFTQRTLPSPSTNTVSMSMSALGEYIAVSTSSSGGWVAKIAGGVVSLVSAPTIANSERLALSPDSNFLAVLNVSTLECRVYRRSGDSFTELFSTVSGLPTLGSGGSVTFSADSQHLVITAGDNSGTNGSANANTFTYRVSIDGLSVCPNIVPRVDVTALATPHAASYTFSEDNKLCAGVAKAFPGFAVRAATVPNISLPVPLSAWIKIK